MNLFYLLTIIFIYVLCVHGKKLNYDLVTDYSVNDCLKVNNDQKKNYFALDTNGFPYCGKYSEAPAACDPANDDSCEPGLKCGASKTCVVDTTSCFKYYANVKDNDNIQKLLWTPDCGEDGSWTSKQCKGGITGRCFCYNTNGKRLFGDAFTENSANMTCACSKRKAELLDSSNPNRRSYVSLHCDQQGNYEELQCDSGHCWCVDTKTGESTTKIVPENAMKYLECYSKLQGAQYLRKCESQAYAQAKIIEEMKKHGTTSPNIQMVSCGGDGSYGPYSIQGLQVYCVTRANAQMNYQSSIFDIASLDCNCAHDQDLYTRLGKLFTLGCSTNGNYEPFQSIVEDNTVKSFCVDRDGNKKLDNVDSKSNNAYCNLFYD